VVDQVPDQVAELVLRAQKGDTAAYEALVRLARADSREAFDALIRLALSGSQRSADALARLSEEGQQEASNELVRLTQAGERGAFDALMRLHCKSVVGFARKILRSMDDAEELAQDVFFKAYRSLHTLDDPKKFRSWLLTIVYRLSLNKLRSKKSRPEGEWSDKVEAVGYVKRPSTGEALVADEADQASPDPALLARVDDAVQALPEAQRFAWLLYTQGFSHERIGELLGCTPGASKTRVFAARKRLVSVLEPYAASA
jgi:RNA polymerase sigma-70 factor (ECF subfamily)